MEKKKRSKAQEDRTAKKLGGQTRIASGALDHMKADVKTEHFLIENKYTDKDYYILTSRTWYKVRKEALREGLREPMMQVDIQDKSYYILDYNLVKDLPFMPELLARPERIDKKQITLRHEGLYLADWGHLIVLSSRKIDKVLEAIDWGY